MFWLYANFATAEEQRVASDSENLNINMKAMKAICLSFIFVIGCWAQATSGLITIPDITMTGSAVPVTVAHTYVHWCQFTTPASNSAVVAWGDALVTLTRGSTIASGGGQSIPATGPVYDLATIYFIGVAGNKVKTTCQIF